MSDQEPRLKHQTTSVGIFAMLEPSMVTLLTMSCQSTLAWLSALRVSPSDLQTLLEDDGSTPPGAGWCNIQIVLYIRSISRKVVGVLRSSTICRAAKLDGCRALPGGSAWLMNISLRGFVAVNTQTARPDQLSASRPTQTSLQGSPSE